MTEEGRLIERSRAGDRAAFSALVKKYEGRIFQLAQRVCASAPAEADDISQETFVTAFQKLDQFQSRASLGTWLHRIASNLCWMRLRRRRREIAAPFDEEARPPATTRVEHADDPARRARKRELQRAVASALDELPLDQRMVVVLRDIRDLSAAETAKILGLSVTAVKSRLHRGRARLRERLMSHAPHHDAGEATKVAKHGGQ